METRAQLGNTLHQAGRLDEANEYFSEAEIIYRHFQPKHLLLSSISGWLYCDLLLSASECVAWRRSLEGDCAESELQHSEVLRTVFERAKTASQIPDRSLNLLEEAIGPYMLARTLLKAMLNGDRLEFDPESLKTMLDGAVTAFRRAGYMDELPRGLLIRSWLRFLSGSCIGTESAQEDLDEAWEIAERGR